MTRKPLFPSVLISLFVLLALPVLACNTLLGDDSGSSVEIGAASNAEEEASGETDAESGAADSGDTGASSASDEGAISGGDATDIIAEAFSAGLSVDAVRLTIHQETDISPPQDIILTFVRPDRYQMASGDVEFIAIGDTTYLKVAEDSWLETDVPMDDTVGTFLDTFLDAQSVEEQLAEFKDESGELKSLGDETINGVSTAVYEYNQVTATGDFENRMKLWIGREDNRIHRQEIETTIAGSKTFMVLEYEYGPDVTIEAPIP